jgi:4-hydroxymandelate oxidase
MHMTELATPSRRPLNLHEYEIAARELLSPMIFDFIASGSCDEITLRANRSAFDRWRLIPRVMRGVASADTRTSVLGQSIDAPVIVAPTSLHRLATPEGERATARAAKSAGTIYTMSTAASLPLEEIATEAGLWWFQCYVFIDRGLTAELIQRAVDAGASAIVMTADLSRFGRREADERNQFALPDGVSMPNMRAAGARPELVDRNPSNLLPSIGGAFDPGLTWDDLEWLVQLAGVPVLVKGVLHPDDAVLAFEHGAQGVVVSNHGGRQLDGSIATLDALPAIADACAGRGEILLDGGVRRGTDVLRALALGARAVMIGRPVLWGLAVAGEAGARHVLDHLRAEIESDLMLCGLRSPGEVNRDLVVKKG